MSFIQLTKSQTAKSPQMPESPQRASDICAAVLPDYSQDGDEDPTRVNTLRQYFKDDEPLYMVLNAKLEITYYSKQSNQLQGTNGTQVARGVSFLDLLDAKYKNCVSALQSLSETREQLVIKNVPMIKGTAPAYFTITFAHYEEQGEQGIVARWEDTTQLIHLEEQLEVARYELEYMIYKASHDLRAPLLSVLGLVGISEASHEPIQNDCLPLIKKSILKLDKFISDMVSFSENQKMMVRTEKIDFKPMLESVIGHMHKISPNVAHVEIKQDLHIGEGFYSDPVRLSLIISNLLSNAFQFFDPRKEQPGIELRVQTSADHAEIIVTDNGRGIEQEVMDRIFDMFFRGSEHSKGSGLGLYMVKEAVNKLQGEIRVNSTPNQGTVFTVKLPNQQVMA